MRKFLLAGLIACCCTILPAQEIEKSKQLSRSERIDELFSAWNSADTPGVAVVAVENGEVVLRRGYGSANLEYAGTITPATVFDAGSMAKPFTGLTVAMLAVEGKLSLDDDIRDYLPQLPDYSQKITIQHLLHHSSGIQDYFGIMAIAGVRLEDTLSNEEVLKVAYRLRELNYEPGSRSTYSNTGYVLAAAIVEKVTGQRFGTWMQENIFRPFGMNNTLFLDDYHILIKDRAYSYSGNKRTGYRKMGNSSSVVGSGGLMTTADDMAKWILNFETADVGGTAAFKLIQTEGKLSNGEGIGYGLGLSIDEYRGLKRFSHGGGSAGFVSRFAYFPEQRFGVVVWGNFVSFNSSAILNQIVDICLEDQLQPLPSTTGSGDMKTADIDPKIFDGYAGDYKLEDGTIITFGRYYNRYFSTKLGQSFVEIFPESEVEFVSRNGKLRISFLRESGEPSGRISLEENGENYQGNRIEQPPIDVLRDYIGSYYCSTVNTVWEIVEEHGRLSIRHIRLSNLPPMTYLDKDLFSAGYIIEFTRSASGAIDGFSLSSSRIKNIHFVKTEY